MDSMSVGYGDHAFLHLYPVAGIVIHANRAGNAVVLVANVIADDLAAGVVDRLAFPLDRRADLGFLVMRLDPVAGVAAADGASHRGQRLALAATDLVPDEAADHRANRGTGNAVLILGWSRMRDGLVSAYLLRGVHRRTHRLDADHLGVLDSGIGAGRFQYIDHQTVHHHDLLCLVAA